MPYPASPLQQIAYSIKSAVSHFSGIYSMWGIRLSLCIYSIFLVFFVSAQQPYVSNIDPNTGGQGAEINIYGSNLVGTTAVQFGGVPATSFIITGGGYQIKAIVGLGASGRIKVTTPAGVDSNYYFTYNNTPVIDNFQPAVAKAGDTVVITGRYFSNASGVKFGAIPAAWFGVKNAGTIQAIPQSAGESGYISVVTPSGTGYKSSFVFARKPVINTFSPTAGYAGTVIRLYGENLTPQGYAPQSITVGGTAATYVYTNANQSVLDFQLGAGATGKIKISHPGGADSIAGFTFIPPPVVNSFTPTSAQPTDTVTIRGQYFYDISRVYFGDSLATFFSVFGDTLIKAVVGHGKSGSVRVVQNNGYFGKAGFTFIPLPPPVVQSFSPQTAITGSTITVTGLYLWGVTSAKVGTTPVKYYQQVNKETLKLTAPINGSGPISVTTYYGNYVLAAPVFEKILPPAIDSFSPYKAAAGQLVTIYGQGFGSDTQAVKIHFGAVLATIENLQNNVITVRVPVSATHGPIDVTVRNLTATTNRNFLPIYPPTGYLNLTSDAFLNVTDIGQSGIAYDRQTVSFDMNGDGKPDFATVSSYGDVTLTLNQSTPGNTAWKISGGLNHRVLRLQPADIDGDGKTDLAASNYYGDPFVYLNVSTPDSIKFVAASSSNGIAGEVADMNGDGKPDIVTMVSNSQPMAILNNSIPGLVSFRDTLNINAAGITVPISLKSIADMNNDGLPDLIGISGQSVIVYRNTGTKQVPAFDSLPVSLQINGLSSSPYLYPENIIPSDMNGDGLLDLLVPHNAYNSASFCLYRNTSSFGNIRFGPYQFYQNFPVGPAGLRTGDFNGDGLPDILTGQDSWTYIFQNKSTADSIILGSRIDRRGGTEASCIVDVDGDGKQDIASSSYRIYVMRNRLNEPILIKLCPGDTLRLQTVFNGIFFQWQINTGNGFTDLADDSVFYGTDTRTLTIPNVPSGIQKYQFRCVVNTLSNATLINEPFAIQTSNTWIAYSNSRNWHLASNWSCGKVPDGNTDVVIPGGKYVELTMNGTCRSITISPSANFTVRSPARLTVTNQ